jgi:subtilisin-like proprotein convertase family protein
MKKFLQTLFLILIVQLTFGQSNLWKQTTLERIKQLPTFDRANMPLHYKLYNLDYDLLKSTLAQSPLSSNVVTTGSNTIIEVPNADGVLQHFKMYESTFMESGLQAKFPAIKSYIGQGVEDATASITVSSTLFGIHIMVLSGAQQTLYIDTYTKNLENYIVYERDSIKRSNTFQCLNEDTDVPVAGRMESNLDGKLLVNDGILRQYRLAMACTIEYAAFHVNAAGLNAGTLDQKKAAVQSAMNVTMTRVNGLYLRDMSLIMNFIANNDLIIFIDSDNFSNNDAGTLINESQTVIDAVIGTANYDIGHTVSTGGGGVAQLQSPCSNSKARGITGSPSPVGDPYDIDFVAHEMGHQFGGTHTFNNSCGNNRSSSTAVEPGSGSTIMAYAGICAPDVQSNSDAHFHAVSIAQMSAFVLAGGNCAVATPNGNFAPVVVAGPSYSIPNGTAFILKGSATDANGDALTFCWEQTNNQVSTQPPVATSLTGPNFRSNIPTTSPNRYMPAFASVLLGNLAPTWEVIPNVARTMSFALTVRDNRMPNGGQTNRGNMNVTFTGDGAFAITSPSANNTSWNLGSTQTITWNVANTTAAPVLTANVKISYSTNGGATFTTLIASTPNDGSETITVPNTLSTTGRIMIEAIDNIYYCVSKNIAFGYNITNACNTYNGSSLPIVTSSGIPANQIGTVNVPITGSISSVAVFNNITHMYLSDVITDISSPQNPTVFVKAFNRFCGNTNGSLNLRMQNVGNTLNCTAGGLTLQTIAPGQSFTTFESQNPQGVWTLRVYDQYAPDDGTLNSWGIEICTQSVTLSSEVFGLDSFAIFPNPSNGNFNVKFNSSSNNQIEVYVHDLRGREVFMKKFQNTGLFDQNLRLASVQSGVYLVTVQDGDKKEVKKIIIE